MHYILLFFILIPLVWCRASHKKKYDAEEHQLQQHKLVTEHPKERKQGRSRALIIFFCHYAYSRKKGVWPCRKGEAYVIYWALTGEDLEW